MEALMNEYELIRAVSIECDLSLSQTKKVFESLASNIKIALKENKTITQKGLGTFTNSVIRELVESNPITHEPIRYVVTHFPEFHPEFKLESSSKD